MSLTEFLLARVVEEEDEVQHWVDEAPGVWRDWVRSACEVKRRVIALHARDPGDGQAWDPACTVVASDVRTPDACITLRELAQSYADHPDFRDDWRP